LVNKDIAQQIAAIKYLIPDELSRLLAEVQKHGTIRDYAIITLAYRHGMRISEVRELRNSDFDQDSRRIFIRRIKGGISASYRMEDEAFKALQRWRNNIRGPLPGPLFVTRQTPVGVEHGQIKGISKSQLDSLFRGYCRRAKIPEDKQHFHVLRHTCAVDMVDKDVPMIQIQDWLGHKNIASTQIYAKVSDAKRNETADLFYRKEQEEKELDPIARIKEAAKELPQELKIQWRKEKKRKIGR